MNSAAVCDFTVPHHMSVQLAGLSVGAASVPAPHHSQHVVIAPHLSRLSYFNHPSASLATALNQLCTM